MKWAYKFEERALKEFKKLDRQAQAQILSYLNERVAGDEDPPRFGKLLKANLAGIWRYRVGDYRILCHIADGQLTVVVVGVENRRNIYE